MALDVFMALDVLMALDVFIGLNVFIALTYSLPRRINCLGVFMALDVFIACSLLDSTYSLLSEYSWALLMYSLLTLDVFIPLLAPCAGL